MVPKGHSSSWWGGMEVGGCLSFPNAEIPGVQHHTGPFSPLWTTVSTVRRDSQ